MKKTIAALFLLVSFLGLTACGGGGGGNGNTANKLNMVGTWEAECFDDGINFLRDQDDSLYMKVILIIDETSILKQVHVFEDSNCVTPFIRDRSETPEIPPVAGVDRFEQEILFEQGIASEQLGTHSSGEEITTPNGDTVYALSTEIPGKTVGGSEIFLFNQNFVKREDNKLYFAQELFNSTIFYSEDSFFYDASNGAPVDLDFVSYFTLVE